MEGLSTLVNLRELDLRDNLLQRIEGLENLASLTCVQHIPTTCSQAQVAGRVVQCDPDD